VQNFKLLFCQFASPHSRIRTVFLYLVVLVCFSNVGVSCTRCFVKITSSPLGLLVAQNPKGVNVNKQGNACIAIWGCGGLVMVICFGNLPY